MKQPQAQEQPQHHIPAPSSSEISGETAIHKPDAAITPNAISSDHFDDSVTQQSMSIRHSHHPSHSSPSILAHVPVHIGNAEVPLRAHSSYRYNDKTELSPPKTYQEIARVAPGEVTLGRGAVFTQGV